MPTPKADVKIKIEGFAASSPNGNLTVLLLHPADYPIQSVQDALQRFWEDLDIQLTFRSYSANFPRKLTMSPNPKTEIHDINLESSKTKASRRGDSHCDRWLCGNRGPPIRRHFKPIRIHAPNSGRICGSPSGYDSDST